ICADSVVLSPDCTISGACKEILCRATTNACAAQLLLEIVSIRAAPVKIDFSLQGIEGPPQEAHYSIPPQSTATNEALAEQAAILTRTAMSNAGKGIGLGVGLIPANPNICSCETPQVLGTTLPDGRTYGSIFSHTYVESYQLHREAVLKAVDTTLAVADS